MIYCVDIDGTLCSNTDGDYERAVPDRDVISRINELSEEGHIVNLFTARGSTTGIDWREFTEAQMKEWGVIHDRLIMGKPEADVFIDDKCIHVSDWMQDVKVPRG